MIIRVKGGNAEQRKLVRDAARWVVSTALPIKKKIVLNIRFTNHDLDGTFGTATHNAQSSWRSKSFSVLLNTDEINDDAMLLETMLHEMVHIWQMATHAARYSLTRDGSEYRVFWKGKIFNPYKGYSKHPWERQAYRMEKQLVEQFLASR